LLDACETGNFEKVKELISSGDVNSNYLDINVK